MSDQDPQTRLRNVPPNRWLTYAFLLALGLAVFFVWFLFRGQEGQAADPIPTPTPTAGVVATMTPTFRPLIVLTAPPTPVPTATAVPSAVVVPVRIVPTEPPAATDTPVPTETPTAQPSMVQRGEVPPTGRST
jgi:hypothetical protein